MSSHKNRGLKALLQDADEEQRQAIVEVLPYDVGFAKPPQTTRFSSSNQPARRGRRRKPPQDPGAIFAEELSVLVEVVEGNKRRKLSKLRVGLRQLANKMASGDRKALELGLDLIREFECLDSSSPASIEEQTRYIEEGRRQNRDIVSRLLAVARAKREMANENGE